jgi:hypothetical protein
MHYGSAAGIEPSEVTDATFTAFREHLELTLLKDPPIVFRETLLGWNAARTQVPGWPDIALIIPARTTAWTLPWSAFPESLRLDVIRYLDRLGGRDPLEELPFRPVRPLTLEHREYQIRQFASALVLRGRDSSTLTSLGDLIAIDTFKDGLRYLLERRGGRSTATVVHLATSLKAIARHHVRVDAQHLERMAAVIGRLDPPKRGLTAKNRSRLRALDDPKMALALVQLPAKLMAWADRERRPLRAARLAQTAVAIEVLLMAPIRIGNLANLDLERHLIRPSRVAVLVAADLDAHHRLTLLHPLPEIVADDAQLRHLDDLPVLFRIHARHALAGARVGIPPQLLQPRPETAGAADRGISVSAQQGPALAGDQPAADLQLILDRRFALVLGGITGVDDGAHQRFSTGSGSSLIVPWRSARRKS